MNKYAVWAVVALLALGTSASAVTLSGTPTALPGGTSVTGPLPTAAFNPANWTLVDSLTSNWSNGTNFAGQYISEVWTDPQDPSGELLFRYVVVNDGVGADPTVLTATNFALDGDVVIEDAGLNPDGDVAPDFLRRDTGGAAVRWFFFGQQVAAGEKQDTLFLGTTATLYERSLATVQDSPSSVQNIPVLVPATTVIPEPLTVMAVMSGVAGVAGYIRKRKHG